MKGEKYCVRQSSSDNHSSFLFIICMSKKRSYDRARASKREETKKKLRSGAFLSLNFVTLVDVLSLVLLHILLSNI